MRLLVVLSLVALLSACSRHSSEPMLPDYPGDPHCSGCGADEGVLIVR